MAPSPAPAEAAAARAEHERREARIEALLGLLARAPSPVRGRPAWELSMPRSALPRPSPEGWLAQAAERGREAGARIRKPLLLRLLGIGRRRWEEERRAEAERVERLARLLAGDPPVVELAVGNVLAGLDLPVPVRATFSAGPGGGGRIEAALPSIDVLPQERTSITKTGRVSTRSWPERERNEAYARLVASVALLLGAVALDAAPGLESVLVEGFVPAVDPRTGEDSRSCLVSADVRREVLARLRLDRVDPAAALENFEHRFDVGRGAVLREVDPLSEEAGGTEGAAEPEGAGVREEPSRTSRPAAARRARRAAAEAPPAPAARGVREPPGGSADESSIAADALRLAVACARSDGRFDPAEVAAIERLIADRFAPGPVEKKRLDLLREDLKDSAIDVTAAAARLRGRLVPLERRLLVEGILEALRAKGSAEESETRLLESVAEKLDVPAMTVRSARARASREPSPGGRAHLLAALDLPPDALVTREAVERAARRVLDTHAETRFAGLGGEFASLARKRREEAAAAREALLADLPPGEAAPAPAAAPPDGPAPGAAQADGTVRRENADLDEIFG